MGGPTKPAETRRAGAELKRFTHLAFLSGWRRGDAGDERPTRGTTVEDHAGAAAAADAPRRRRRRRSLTPSRRKSKADAPAVPPTFLPPPTESSCRRPSSHPKLESFKRNSDGIVQVMERMVQVREKEVSQEQPLQKFSITICMDALKTLDGMTGSIKIPALDVFTIADNREIFLNLVDDKDGTAMVWLLVQIAKLA
nr:uncharacterized protein LOC127346996 [Lolium perenne]